MARHFAIQGKNIPPAFLEEPVEMAWQHLTGHYSTLSPGPDLLDFFPVASGRACSQVAFRDELQARLLAGESNEQISARLMLRPDQVEIYERLCFAVRDRLQVPSYVRHVAIGQFNGNSIDRLGVFWREIAYWRGSPTLEWVVGALRNLPTELQQQGIYAYTHREAEVPALLRLAVHVTRKDALPRECSSSLPNTGRDCELSLGVRNADWAVSTDQFSTGSRWFE